MHIQYISGYRNQCAVIKIRNIHSDLHCKWLSSSLTGPGGVDLELQPVAMGSIGRTGQNTYTVTSGTLSGRSNGDTY